MGRGHCDVVNGFKPLLRRTDSVYRYATIHNERDLVMREGKCRNMYSGRLKIRRL